MVDKVCKEIPRWLLPKESKFDEKDVMVLPNTSTIKENNQEPPSTPVRQENEEVKQNKSQDVVVSLMVESNEEENDGRIILQEKYDEEPYAVEDSTSHHQVVGSVRGEFTSNFFVIDFQITAKGIDFSKVGETYFGSDSKE